MTVMRYFLLQICPPLAVLSCGKPFSFIWNTILWFWPWSTSRPHAEWVLNQWLEDQRFVRLGDRLPEKKKPKYIKKYEPAADEEEGTVYRDPTVGAKGTKFRPRS